MRTTTVRRLAVAAAVLLVTAACGGNGGGSGSATGPTPRERVNPDDCGLAALKKAKKPVEIDFWHTRKGAVPTRISVAEDPAVQSFWTQHPDFKVGFDQLQQGPLDDATSGPLIGPYQEVRNAITNGIALMLAGRATVAGALAKAQSDADAAIADYNRRIGA